MLRNSVIFLETSLQVISDNAFLRIIAGITPVTRLSKSGHF
jgi:hypothetical protein